jgi:hypothetical protein
MMTILLWWKARESRRIEVSWGWGVMEQTEGSVWLHAKVEPKCFWFGAEGNPMA